MPQFYVYVYRDPSRKNEPIYVGKGQDDRAYEHLKCARNPHFKNRLAKMKANGIEPIINVVDMPSEALAVQCEIDTIARLGRKDLGLGPVLNMTDGGEGMSGYVTTAEARKKQSEAQKGRPKSAGTRQKMSNAKIGKPLSHEVRQKMSETMKGTSRPKSICPHCGKSTGPSKYHFDKCKHKKVL